MDRRRGMRLLPRLISSLMLICEEHQRWGREVGAAFRREADGERKVETAKCGWKVWGECEKMKLSEWHSELISAFDHLADGSLWLMNHLHLQEASPCMYVYAPVCVHCSAYLELIFTTCLFTFCLLHVLLNVLNLQLDCFFSSKAL